MTTSPSDARELFEDELDPPVDRDTVVETVGDRTIAAQGGDGTTIETIVERSDTEEFETVAELHDTLMVNLDDDYVGRENYDDRSSNPGRDEEESL